MAIYLLTVCVVFLLVQVTILHRRANKLLQHQHTLVTATHEHAQGMQTSLQEYMNKQIDLLNSEMKRLHGQVSDHVDTKMTATLTKVSAVVGERTAALMKLSENTNNRVTHTVDILKTQDDQITALTGMVRLLAFKVGIDANTPVPTSEKKHAH